MLRKFRFMRAIKTQQIAQEAHAPKVGETAPDFTLYDPNGVQPVTLSEIVGEKPVVLVFGSFT